MQSTKSQRTNLCRSDSHEESLQLDWRELQHTRWQFYKSTWAKKVSTSTVQSSEDPVARRISACDQGEAFSYWVMEKKNDADGWREAHLKNISVQNIGIQQSGT